jgi:hypothetical protein
VPSVTINPPKTPVTKGSNTIAAATIPNVCKMPGPPAPFVPTPLPNIGQGGKSPQKDYSTTVKIEGNDVGIKGSSFGSMGDIASMGTGGGIVSNNAEGPTTFVAPGSLTVKIEGKNVQFLGDQMLNNNGPSGSPANAACMMGAMHSPGPPPAKMPLNVDCGEKKKDKRPGKKWDDCMVEELCAMVKAYNESPHPKKAVSPSPSHPASKFPNMTAAQKKAQNVAFGKYGDALGDFGDDFETLVKAKGKDDPDVVKQFHSECRHKKWSDAGGKVPIPRSGKGAMNPDHAHPAGLGGPIAGPFKWADARVNKTVGPAMDKHDPATHPGGVEAHSSCNCPP